MKIAPFWRYYGGKYRAAPKYPEPVYNHIVEPFAGAAGYATRYHDRRVTLIEKNPRIAGIWRLLIAATAADIRRIPLVEAVDDLPAWVPAEARDLVGFWLTAATTTPRRTLSAGQRALRARGTTMVGWAERSRERVAVQCEQISHWRIIESDYKDAPELGPATYFVDPPYNNKAGSHYPNGPKAIDYAHLSQWCRTRPGQVITCENEGADWLPFAFLAHTKAMQSGKRGAKRTSAEVIWHCLHGVDLSV